MYIGQRIRENRGQLRRPKPQPGLAGTGLSGFPLPLFAFADTSFTGQAFRGKDEERRPTGMAEERHPACFFSVISAEAGIQKSRPVFRHLAQDFTQ